jgi:hypothetical protein
MLEKYFESRFTMKRLDPAKRLATINMVAPPKIRPGRFRPPDNLLAVLKGQSLWGAKAATRPEFAGVGRQLSP